jgi:hypothetical protein
MTLRLQISVIISAVNYASNFQNIGELKSTAYLKIAFSKAVFLNLVGVADPLPDRAFLLNTAD